MSNRLYRLGQAGIAAAIAAVAMFVLSTPGYAQTYPARPVHLVVPLAPGGITDIAARMVGAKLSERIGQPVVVENRAGAAQSIGSEYVARAAPDGYTLIMGNISSHGINAALHTKLRYNIPKDFAPVSLVTSQPLMLAVHPSVPANTVQELVALLKAAPDKYAFGSPGGAGSSGHLSAELLKLRTGTSMLHVPYKGSGPLIAALVGGQVQLAFDNMPTALAQVKAGKLRGLAVTSAERSKFVPDIPTMNEFIPGFQVTAWQGIFAPAGTPAPVLDRLSAEIQAIMKMPEIVQRSTELGVAAEGSTRAAFETFWRDELARWAEVVRASGVKAEE